MHKNITATKPRQMSLSLAIMALCLVGIGSAAASANTGPTTGGVTPALPASMYFGEPADLAAEFHDVDGAADIRGVAIIINHVLAGNQAAYLWYNSTVDRLYLRKDDNSGWVSAGHAPGTAGITMENSQVIVDVGASSVVLDGDTLTLEVNLEFKQAYVGDKNVYLHVYDQALVTNPGGWDDKGVLTIEDGLLVCLMGDPQFGMNANTALHATIAMDDLENLDHQALFILGDLVQNASYWQDYQDYLASQSAVPIYPLAGNAELPDLQAFQNETGAPLIYSTYLDGIRFILISTTQVSGTTSHICHMGDDHLRWLESELDADTVSTTVVLFHAPVAETNYLSGLHYEFYMAESSKVQQLFAANPNVVLYANGHTHIAYGNIDVDGRGHQYLGAGVLYLSVGATAANRGSSCLYIYEDKILARARSHQDEAWMGQFDVVHEVTTTFDPVE